MEDLPKQVTFSRPIKEKNDRLGIKIEDIFYD